MCFKNKFKKLKIILGLLFVSVLLYGCEKDEEKALENFRFNETKTYDISDFIDETSGLKTPQGIVYAADALYVADEDNDCINKYDKEGNLLSVFGGTGNGDGELLSPVALATDLDENIYVAEKGNLRIQVFDKNGKLVKCINLNKLKQNKISELFDIDVSDNDTIYLTVKTYEKDKCKLYAIKDDKVLSLEKEISGVLGTDSTKEHMAYIQSYKWENGYLVGATGYIGMLESDKIRYLNTLPNKYSASDVVIYNNFIYAYSSGYATLDKFSMEGNYIETIFSQEASSENRGMSYMTVDNQGNFYINDSVNSKIYKIEKK